MIESGHLTYRICTGCARRLPVTDFRRVRKGCERRRARCRDCRRASDQAQRQQERDRQLGEAMTEIRRRSSVNGMMAIVQQVAAQCGGLEQLASTWTRLIRDERVPFTRRVKSCQTWIHMAAAADVARYARRLDAEPGEVLRDLHRDGQLLSILRQLVQSGELEFNTLLDAVDPPPFD